MYLSVTYEVTKLYSIDFQSQFVCLPYWLFLKYIIYYYLVGFFDFIIIELLQIKPSVVVIEAWPNASEITSTAIPQDFAIEAQV